MSQILNNSSWMHAAGNLAVLLHLLCAGCDTRENIPAPDNQPQNVRKLEKTQTSEDKNSDSKLRIAASAFAKGDLIGCEQALREHLVKNPKDFAALELAGDVSQRQGEYTEAAQLYQDAAQLNPTPPLRVFNKLAETWSKAGHPYDTLPILEEAARRYADDLETRQGLTGLATLLELQQIAIPQLQWLVQNGHTDLESLLILASPNDVKPDVDFAKGLLKRHPEDLRPHYILAKQEASERKWAEVAERLAPVLEHHPDFAPAHALYGRALVALNESNQIQSWQTNLPQNITDQPSYWLAAGDWATRQGKHKQAARAFSKVIRLDENNSEGLIGLQNSLIQIDRHDTAETVAQRNQKLSAVHDALKTFTERANRSQKAAMDVATGMLEMGRTWEAAGWAIIAVNLQDDPDTDLRNRYSSIRAQLKPGMPWQTNTFDLVDLIDIATLPEVDWDPQRRALPSPASLASQPDVFFLNEADKRGLRHTCDMAADSETNGFWIYQSVGTGVGIADFDLNGWPDAYLGRMNGNPMANDSSTNRLFLNYDGEFNERTQQANALDTGFSQGITVGDFNDDGFPDILDANIGQNRLLRNNGDGTFTDISSEAGLNGSRWSTTMAIADFDGDGNADIFETNYCAGSLPFEKRCGPKNRFSTCPPLQFNAEPDHVWRGNGDGTFSEATAPWLSTAVPGRGLGVTIGDFDDSPGLDVYVANDMTVNHLWSGTGSSDNFRFKDIAVLKGLAASDTGRSQASMGIATGDPDNDGDIDFFVTHFRDDHNTYYEQVGKGLWQDRSDQVGLAQPSMPMLGFGTQFADYDNDGQPELFVANGHVDDLRHINIPFHQPPQIFHYGRDHRWIELDRNKLGSYFQSDHLGRCVVTLDANRDGFIDQIVTHLFEPVAMLISKTQNTTEPQQHAAIGFTLVATEGQRDAIGAKVNLTINGVRKTAQLTAGDGYMGASQRRITFGCNQASEATEVSVQWPSGKQQNLGTLSTRADYLLVENEKEAVTLSEHTRDKPTRDSK